MQVVAFVIAEEKNMLISVIALVVSIIAVSFSMWQFYSERNRNRRVATIYAFDELERDVFCDVAYKESVFREGTDFALREGSKDDIYTWNRATLFLSRIEHFAVGVNSGVYDIGTLNRMAGKFIINEYYRWTPIIETKRRQDPASKHYDEFETLCKKLKRMRGE